MQPVFDVYANVQGRTWAAWRGDVNQVLDAGPAASCRRARSSRCAARSKAWRQRSCGLGFGLLFAAVLVYLLMVVNFQSWLDPFIIITALPGAFVGIVWMLFLSQTTFSVPTLMGAIMAIGVATANSILLVTFANENAAAGKDAFDAALEAGYTRMRPVLMTALAMIIGMLPMSLGLGRRRRAERAARPGRHRRPARRDGRHAAVRAGRVQCDSAQNSPAPDGRRSGSYQHTTRPGHSALRRNE